MPNRVIKDSIKSSAQIDSLTWFEEVVFYRLIVSADDYGCFDGRSTFLKNVLFPTKENVTKKAVEDAINKLASVGLLCKYTVSGMPYLFFPTWEKHQRLRNKHRKYPEPLDSNPPSNDRQMTANCHSEIELEVELEKELEVGLEKKVKKKRVRSHVFTPPSFEEVEEYARLRGNLVDPKRFFDYFSASEWHDSTGKPVKNWKQKMITWEGGKWDGGTCSQKPNNQSCDASTERKWNIRYDVAGDESEDTERKRGQS